MTKRTAHARLVLDVEKEIHKKLKTIALEEDKSLKTLMLEAIDKILKERSRKKPLN